MNVEQLPTKQKEAWEAWSKWKQANPDLSQDKFLKAHKNISNSTLYAVRVQMRDIRGYDAIAEKPAKKKTFSEATKKKISEAVKKSYKTRMQGGVMQTFIVPEEVREPKVVVVVCGLSQVKELLNGFN